MDDFTRQYNIDDIIPYEFTIFDRRCLPDGRALVVIFIRFAVATGGGGGIILSPVYCCKKNWQTSAQRMIVLGLTVVGGVQLDVAPTTCTGGGGGFTYTYPNISCNGNSQREMETDQTLRCIR